jgi:hypothetical protein
MPPIRKEKRKMIVIGAGMAGLLAGNMLRRFKPYIWEGKEDLPINHSALLRFRTDKVGIATAIPFEKVKVRKAIQYNGEIYTQPNIHLSNMYSKKVTGSVLARSIDNLESSERFIAPNNFVNTMATNCDIAFRKRFDFDNWMSKKYRTPLISTIPMPALMKMVGWKDMPDFNFQNIWTQKAVIDNPECDVHQTIYYPDPIVPYYRISIMGNVIISEFIEEPSEYIGAHLSNRLNEDFGFMPKKLIDFKESKQVYGKIKPINERLRKEFVFEMTNKYKIYSVGRFATWRQLLLDDLINDLKMIDSFITSDSSYSRLIHSQKGENNES